jgi:hypothetical protein
VAIQVVGENGLALVSPGLDDPEYSMRIDRAIDSHSNPLKTPGQFLFACLHGLTPSPTRWGDEGYH